MIEHVFRRAAEARGVDAVVVATDDDRIARVVEGFGGVARMTSAAHATGTDRIAELARDLPCDVVVNVQGDLPLLEPDMIAEVLAPLASDATVRMTTLRRRIASAADRESPHVVKVVVDGNGDALYFSRAAIPFCREGTAPAWRHIGLYAYRRDVVLALANLPQTPLERAESLEQLRALEHGIRIRTVETRHETIEVDTPEDLERVRQALTTRV